VTESVYRGAATASSVLLPVVPAPIQPREST